MDYDLITILCLLLVINNIFHQEFLGWVMIDLILGSSLDWSKEPSKYHHGTVSWRRGKDRVELINLAIENGH